MNQFDLVILISDCSRVVELVVEGIDCLALNSHGKHNTEEFDIVIGRSHFMRAHINAHFVWIGFLPWKFDHEAELLHRLTSV